jgi:hypothetical protein
MKESCQGYHWAPLSWASASSPCLHHHHISLDYCMNLLISLSASHFAPLWSFGNTAATVMLLEDCWMVCPLHSTPSDDCPLIRVKPMICHLLRSFWPYPPWLFSSVLAAWLFLQPHQMQNFVLSFCLQFSAPRQPRGLFFTSFYHVSNTFKEVFSWPPFLKYQHSIPLDPSFSSAHTSLPKMWPVSLVYCL